MAHGESHRSNYDSSSVGSSQPYYRQRAVTVGVSAAAAASNVNHQSALANRARNVSSVSFSSSPTSYHYYSNDSIYEYYVHHSSGSTVPFPRNRNLQACTCSSPTIPPGANVIAIDNKIEQAMDLVKTHLMYAVREEVEVLKDKITDLERKVSRLEWENQILRENAAPEVLAQIQQAVASSGSQPTQSSVALSANQPAPAMQSLLQQN